MTSRAVEMMQEMSAGTTWNLGLCVGFLAGWLFGELLRRGLLWLEHRR